MVSLQQQEFIISHFQRLEVPKASCLEGHSPSAGSTEETIPCISPRFWQLTAIHGLDYGSITLRLCLCLHMAFSCVSPCPNFPLLKRIPAIGLRSILIQHDHIFNLITSAKTLLSSKVTFHRFWVDMNLRDTLFNPIQQPLGEGGGQNWDIYGF